MPYSAESIENFATSYGTNGEKDVVIGSGECVDFVKGVVESLKSLSAHNSWKRGKRVKGNPNAKTGMAIGFFDAAGDYVSARGKSHAAIYVKQDPYGITVWHQYSRRSVHQAVLYFRSANPRRHFTSESMNGDNFYFIELAKDPNPERF